MRWKSVQHLVGEMECFVIGAEFAEERYAWYEGQSIHRQGVSQTSSNSTIAMEDGASRQARRQITPRVAQLSTLQKEKNSKNSNGLLIAQ